MDDQRINYELGHLEGIRQVNIPDLFDGPPHVGIQETIKFVAEHGVVKRHAAHVAKAVMPNEQKKPVREHFRPQWFFENADLAARFVVPTSVSLRPNRRPVGEAALSRHEGMVTELHRLHQTPDCIPLSMVKIQPLSVGFSIVVANTVNGHKEFLQEGFLRIVAAQIFDNDIKNWKPLVQRFIGVNPVAYFTHVALPGDHNTYVELGRNTTQLSTVGKMTKPLE